MPKRTDLPKSPVDEATALARFIAPDLASILLTHYADSDTLDTLRPGEADLDTVTAVNKAVATAMAKRGVEIFVQRADRAAFRRWMDGREDTPSNRRRWIDRSKLLRGAPALRLLGLPVPAAAPPVKYPVIPGPMANRLVAAFDAEDGTAFEALAQGLIGAGRDDMLNLAVRKMADQHGEEAGAELEAELRAAAAGGRFGPAGWAEIVTLPVALPSGDPPDAATIGDSFVTSGFLEESMEIRFLPGWRSPEALAELSPSSLRRVLLDLVAGIEPRDLPPGDTDDLARNGFGLLLGLQLDWDIPVWDQIAAEGLPEVPDEDAPETPEEARRAALLDAWRGAMFDTHDGCVPLSLVPPTEVDAEIADFLDEAAEQSNAIDEIRAFVAMVRREAGTDDIVGQAEITGDRLELTLYTEAGRFMDSLTLTPDRMAGSPEETLQLIATLVRVVKDAPGR